MLSAEASWFLVRRSLARGYCLHRDRWVGHISLVFREMWDATARHRQVSHRTYSKPHGWRLQHLVVKRARYRAPIDPRQGEIPGANYLRLGYSQPVLPGGNSVPPLVGSSVQHVDTPGVHMLGHLEDSVELVVQGRFASRTRQRIVTRSQSNFVCTHNEYWYTSARTPRKCANHTITCPRRGQRASPLDRPPGYLGGKPHNPTPADDGYLQQNRWQISQGRGLPKWPWLPGL